MERKEDRFVETLLGMLGVSLLLIGLAIHGVEALLLVKGWSMWWEGILHLGAFVFTLYAAPHTSPKRIEHRPQTSGKWMLACGLIGLWFSWFTALAGLLLISGGLLCLRKRQDQKKGSTQTYLE
ncbi:hypothetical protein [Salinithrix halophila]|uniref:Uncharacterized protein n=1 Tax=Salinithrix halophila TaxID=1485204 RepID=A0ABV8JGJ1_9BACL